MPVRLYPTRRSCIVSLALIAACIALTAAASPDVTPKPRPSSDLPAVFTLSIIPAQTAAGVVHAMYPHAFVRVERGANALIVVAPPDEVAAIRTVVAGIDVKDPSAMSVESLQLHSARPNEVMTRLHTIYPNARFTTAPNRNIIVAAAPIDMVQIKAIVAAIDTPPAAPTLQPAYPTQVIRVLQADTQNVARALAREIRSLRVAVSGSDLLVSGPPDDVAGAKTQVELLDHVGAGVKYAKVYHLHAVTADSVAALLQRSFPGVLIAVDSTLNAITVRSTARTQNQIVDAIGQLDVVSSTSGSGLVSGSGGTQTEVVTLKAAVPASNGQASTSAADIAQSVSQALAGQAGDLKIMVHPNSTRLILSGGPYSIRLAKDLIAKLDVAEPLVELDTEVYEVDDGLQKQLGVKFPTAALSTTYSEVAPIASTDGSAARVGRLQALTRTPLTLAAQLDFLVSSNRARILEDPRITTFSGRTASLRAGETVNVLTTAGGGTGTVATTQIQSFQTGVTLDITPVVNSDDYVTITLHPSVNTEAGISAAGVPNIQNRETTTTVGLHDGETIVVGGLIEDTNSRTVTKIPILGELPVIGRLFQDVGTTHTRNELVVTVTPHIIKGGFRSDIINRDLLNAPTAATLPSLAADATLPPRRLSRVAQPIGFAPTPPSESSGIAPGAPIATMTPVPAPLPSAFAQINVFTYGSPPPNNFANASQPPQIFYVQAKPSVIKAGQPVTIAAVTTSNVTTLTFGTSATDTSQSLGSIGAGKWQGIVNVNSIGIGTSSGNIIMFLTATTAAGATTTTQIPFSLVR